MFLKLIQLQRKISKRTASVRIMVADRVGVPAQVRVLEHLAKMMPIRAVQCSIPGEDVVEAGNIDVE